jgi:CheY-like chemotaxis protein
MVIDDDTTFQFIFRKMIEKQDSIEIVNDSKDGIQALNYLKDCIREGHGFPDIIILDLNMPRLDGWGFLDEFSKLERAMGRDIPICILSSTINQSDFDKANTYETVKSFFSKPITSDQIQSMRKLAGVYCKVH